MTDLTLEEKEAKTREALQILKEMNYAVIASVQKEEDKTDGIFAVSGKTFEVINLILNLIEKIPGAKEVIITNYALESIAEDSNDD